ncbi:MAG: YccF domain-containing protein [Prevotella sp.]|jgi:uncharacterized membrane protein YccF (DUF307 family)
MKLLCNILWMIFGGLVTAIEYMATSFVLMITIIGIPFAIVTFRIGLYVLWPFGQKIVDKPSSADHGCLNMMMNILWILCGGLAICLTHILIGALLCLTIVGIPFGKKQFSLAGLALAPFGKEVVSE